jgi:IPT/TIG domain
MLRKITGLIGVFIVTGAMLFFSGCMKSSPSSPTTPPTTPPVTPPVAGLAITGINPTSGPDSTLTTITGTGFGAVATQDSCYFDGHSAMIVSVNDTVMVVRVPALAGTGPVSVETGGKTQVGPVFTYQYTYTVSTFAGGAMGDMNGTGTSAEFNDPYGIWVDTAGNVIVADDGNNKIRMVTPAGVVSTVAGTGAPGFMNGPASTAQFLDPPAVAVDPMNNILVGDVFNYKVREISTMGFVSTIAGTTVGEMNGPDSTAQFDSPTWLAEDSAGNIFVCDAHYIREISGGSVSTLYDGHTYSSTLNSFTSVAIGPGDLLYLLDDFGANVFTLTTGGTFNVLAGNGILAYQDGAALSASFSSATGLSVDAKGNILVADEANSRIRMISPGGTVSTIAGSGAQADQDGIGTAAEFYYPHGVAVDKKSGTIYVLEPMSNRIRKITVE